PRLRRRPPATPPPHPASARPTAAVSPARPAPTMTTRGVELATRGIACRGDAVERRCPSATAVAPVSAATRNRRREIPAGSVVPSSPSYVTRHGVPYLATFQTGSFDRDQSGYLSWWRTHACAKGIPASSRPFGTRSR